MQGNGLLDPDAPFVPWSAPPSTLQVTSDGLSLRTVRIPDGDFRPVREQMRAKNRARQAPAIKYATGRIKTAEKWAHMYGWFEIEVQVPRGKGRWPAFWLILAGLWSAMCGTCGRMW